VKSLKTISRPLRIRLPLKLSQLLMLPLLNMPNITKNYIGMYIKVLKTLMNS